MPNNSETELIGDTRDFDTITVTNKSGDTSSWELYYNPLDTTHGTDAYVGVYGRSKYVQVVNERAKAELAYFRPEKDYDYFGITSDVIRSGVDYFVYNEAEQQYNRITDLIVGTKVSDYDFEIFERSLFRTRWVRDTHPAGELITEKSNVYVVDGSTSSDRSSCTLPDGVTTWSIYYSNSECIARILERDDGGTVVWCGSVPLAYFSFGPKDGIDKLQLHFSLSRVFQKYLDIEAIKALDFTFYDRKENRYFSKKIHTYIDDLDPATHVRGEDLFFFEDMCGLTTYVGRIITKMDVGAVFIAGVRYFTSEDDGEHFESYSPVIGDRVPDHELTTDHAFVAGKKYYKKPSTTYILLHEGTDYDVGDSIDDFGLSVYEEAREFYVEGDLIVAGIEVALGTSSYINDRFDLRQVRMHL